MYREFFAHSPLLALPLVALVIFLVAFCAVLLSVVLRRAKQFDGVAALPLAAQEDADG